MNKKQPISLELFSEIIEAIKKQGEKENKFCDALEEMIDGRFVPRISENINRILLKLLKEIFNDEGEWIEYFIYEKNFGKDKKMKCWDKNEKEIPLNTIKDLYNLITQ